MTTDVGVWLHYNDYEKFFKQLYYFRKLLICDWIIKLYLPNWRLFFKNNLENSLRPGYYYLLFN
jgi:hypothetical protein